MASIASNVAAFGAGASLVTTLTTSIGSRFVGDTAIPFTKKAIDWKISLVATVALVFVSAVFARKEHIRATDATAESLTAGRANRQRTRARARDIRRSDKKPASSRTWFQRGAFFATIALAVLRQLPRVV